MTDSIAPAPAASAARLLRGGTVLTSDPQVADLLRGDVLIRGGRIAAVGEDLPVGPNVEIVDVSGTIVLPGLVDAHQHVWEGRTCSNTRRWGSARTSPRSSPRGRRR